MTRDEFDDALDAVTAAAIAYRGGVSNDDASTATHTLGTNPWTPIYRQLLVVRLRFDLVQGGSAASDLGDDVLGGGFPDEWCGVVVPVFGPGGDGLSEVGHAGEHAAA